MPWCWARGHRCSTSSRRVRCPWWRRNVVRSTLLCFLALALARVGSIMAFRSHQLKNEKRMLFCYFCTFDAQTYLNDPKSRQHYHMMYPWSISWFGQDSLSPCRAVTDSILKLNFRDTTGGPFLDFKLFPVQILKQEIPIPVNQGMRKPPVSSNSLWNGPEHLGFLRSFSKNDPFLTIFWKIKLAFVDHPGFIWNHF